MGYTISVLGLIVITCSRDLNVSSSVGEVVVALGSRERAIFVDDATCVAPMQLIHQASRSSTHRAPVKQMVYEHVMKWHLVAPQIRACKIEMHDCSW